MSKLYIKNGVILPLKNIQIVKDGFRTINPSEEMVLADGWAEYIPPVTEIPEISLEEQYKNRIVELIKERYSTDDEIAVLRQRESKPDEFDEYNAYVEGCKAQAREELGL